MLSVERTLSLGITKARIHFLGERGELVDTYVSEKLMASPAVGAITPDSRSDVAYSFGSVFVLAGEPNRSMLSETFPSYFVGESPSLSLFVANALIDVADQDYRFADEGLPHLPRGFRRAASVASAVYRGIHDAIRRNGYDNVRRRAYTTQREKLVLAAGALLALGRRRGLRAAALRVAT